LNKDASPEEIRSNYSLHKEIRIAKAAEKKLNWEKETIRDVFFAFLLCGAPGENLPVLTGLNTPNMAIGSKRGRREMRDVSCNLKSGNIVSKDIVLIKEQMATSFKYFVDKETLKEYLLLMEERGLQHSGEYKCVKDKYFALLRTRLNLSTSDISVQQESEITPSSHEVESGFTVLNAIRSVSSAIFSVHSTSSSSNEESIY